MKIKINNKTPQEVFEALKLKENTLYKVKVKVTNNNLEHTAFLFTGFKTGAYCEVYTNSYEQPIKMMSCYSIKVSKKLSKIKTF